MRRWGSSSMAANTSDSIGMLLFFLLALDLLTNYRFRLAKSEVV